MSCTPYCCGLILCTLFLVASRCCDVGERLPSSCSLYIVVSSTASGGINVEKTIWNTKTKLTNSNFSLLTYMGLSYVGVDVIAFEPRKVGTDHFSLHLIANFTNHAVPHEAVLDAGTYEVKVCQHAHVTDTVYCIAVPTIIRTTDMKF